MYMGNYNVHENMQWSSSYFKFLLQNHPIIKKQFVIFYKRNRKTRNGVRDMQIEIEIEINNQK